MGLLKLAEQMICPYGNGDEHFDVDFLLNRHAEVPIRYRNNVL